MTEQERAIAMYAKGYRYRLTISNAGEPLYAKTPYEAARLMREMYPKERILKTEIVQPDGTLTTG